VKWIKRQGYFILIDEYYSELLPSSDNLYSGRSMKFIRWYSALLICLVVLFMCTAVTSGASAGDHANAASPDILDYIVSVFFSMFGENVPIHPDLAETGQVVPLHGNSTSNLTPQPGSSTNASTRNVGKTPAILPEPSKKVTNTSQKNASAIMPTKQAIVNNTVGPSPRNSSAHSGGVYITSFPAKAELRVDNKIVKILLPAMIYGLKEGLHTIEVSERTDQGKIIRSRSSKVWIYPDAVTTTHFNMAGDPVTRKINISSDNATVYSFTVNGYYPLKKTPSIIEFSGSDEFITVIRNGAYISYSPSGSESEKNSLEISHSIPPLYGLPVVSSPPGGEIFIDGAWSGYCTPAIIPNISAGRHRVIVSLDGYFPGESVVEIPDSEDSVVEKPVSLLLENYPCGPLTIETIPEGADISIDDLATGEKTPHTFQNLPLGIHNITVSRNGETRAIEVSITPGSSHREVVGFKDKGMF
jgi:hypothetical protein